MTMQKSSNNDHIKFLHQQIEILTKKNEISVSQYKHLQAQQYSQMMFLRNHCLPVIQQRNLIWKYLHFAD